jgi:Tfp pilus assembly protein PilF
VINIRLGYPQKAEPYLRKSIELDPDSTDGYANLASLLLNQKKRTEGETVLRQAINKFPDNPQFRLMLGTLLSIEDNTDEAVKEYIEVLKLQPNNAPALNAYGYYLLEHNERLKEALEMIQRALSADPENGFYLDSLGWAYFKIGKLDEAEKTLKKALQGNRKSLAMYEHMGDIYEKQGQRELAIDMWKKALSMFPSPPAEVRLKGKLVGAAKAK